MTFNDFKNELDLYEYSNDYYQLLKKISEAELMDRYLENQRYVTNYGAYMTESGMVFTEGFFAESKSEEETQLIEEKFRDTLTNIWNIIRKGILKLLNGLIKFLSKKRDNLEAKIKACDINKFFGHKLPKGVVETITKAAVSFKNGALGKAGAGAVGGAAISLLSLAAGKGIAKGIANIRAKRIQAEEGVSQEEVILASEALDAVQAEKEGRGITFAIPAGFLPASGELVPTLVCKVANALGIGGSSTPTRVDKTKMLPDSSPSKGTDVSVAALSALRQFDKEIDEAEAAARGTYTSIPSAKRSKLMEECEAAQKKLQARFDTLVTMNGDNSMGRSAAQEEEYQSLKKILPKLSKWTSNLMAAESQKDKIIAALVDTAVEAARMMGEANKADAFGDTAAADAYRQAGAAASAKKEQLEGELQNANKKSNSIAGQASKALNNAKKYDDDKEKAKQRAEEEKRNAFPD